MFTEQEHSRAEPIAVLSYPSWQRRFHGDPAAVWQSVLLYETPITIIGIAPVDFIGTGLPPVPPDLWIPLAMQTRVEPDCDSAQNETRYPTAASATEDFPCILYYIVVDTDKE